MVFEDVWSRLFYCLSFDPPASTSRLSLKWSKWNSDDVKSSFWTEIKEAIIHPSLHNTSTRLHSEWFCQDFTGPNVLLFDLFDEMLTAALFLPLFLSAWFLPSRLCLSASLREVWLTGLTSCCVSVLQVSIGELHAFLNQETRWSEFHLTLLLVSFSQWCDESNPHTGLMMTRLKVLCLTQRTCCDLCPGLYTPSVLSTPLHRPLLVLHLHAHL